MKSLRYPFTFILGTSLVWAFPPHAISWVIFITMAIFLAGLERPLTKSGFWYGYIFYLGAVVAFIGYWFSYYFRLQLGAGYFTSYALTSIICFYTSLYIGGITVLYRKIKTTSHLYNLVCLFPSLWVLTELIRGLFFPRSWYVFGNTQVNNVLFRGFYPILGVYFVSWLIIAIAGCFAYFILYKRHDLRAIIKGMLAVLAGLAFCFGFAQIQYTQKYGLPINISLLQPSTFSSTNPSYSQSIMLETEDISVQLIQKTSADLIVLPETVFGTDPHYLTFGFLDKLRQLTPNKTIIFGSPISWNGSARQTGIVSLDHPGNLIYAKHYLVPFGEYTPFKGEIMNFLVNSVGFQISEYIPGSYYQQPVEILGQKFAFNLCYENAVNEFVAKNARNATILLNQSDLSWYGKTNMKDASLQFSQARALENQRYFLQDGNTGDTVVINPQGEIEQQIPAFQSDELTASVQGYSGTTPFEVIGNLPIWILCCANLIYALFKLRRAAT